MSPETALEPPANYDLSSEVSLNRPYCGDDFIWLPLDEMTQLDQVDIKGCADACEGNKRLKTQSCRYFFWKWDKTSNQRQCSLFGTSYQSQAIYCLKKGAIYQT